MTKITFTETTRFINSSKFYNNCLARNKFAIEKSFETLYHFMLQYGAGE